MPSTTLQAEITFSIVGPVATRGGETLKSGLAKEQVNPKVQAMSGSLRDISAGVSARRSKSPIQSDGHFSFVERLGCGCPPLGDSTVPEGFVFPPNLNDPVCDWPRCAGLVLAVLRAFGGGMEVGRVIETTGLEAGHTRQVLDALRSGGYAGVRTTTTPWYYTTRAARLWAEKPHPHLLGKPFPRYEKRQANLPGRVPPQFWWLFWSGLDPMLVRLPEHAEYVASRMIRFDSRRRNRPAELWALRHLPISVLERLLTSQGFDGSPVRLRVQKIIGQRNRRSC